MASEETQQGLPHGQPTEWTGEEDTCVSIVDVNDVVKMKIMRPTYDPSRAFSYTTSALVYFWTQDHSVCEHVSDKKEGGDEAGKPEGFWFDCHIMLPMDNTSIVILYSCAKGVGVSEEAWNEVFPKLVHIGHAECKDGTSILCMDTKKLLSLRRYNYDCSDCEKVSASVRDEFIDVAVPIHGRMYVATAVTSVSRHSHIQAVREMCMHIDDNAHFTEELQKLVMDRFRTAVFNLYDNAEKPEVVPWRCEVWEQEIAKSKKALPLVDCSKTKD